MLSKKDYVLTQVGNPEGEDKPNKKYVKFTLNILRKADTYRAPVQIL